MLLRLYVKFLKEGQNHGVNHSLMKLSMKSSLACHVAKLILKIVETFETFSFHLRKL